MVFSHNILEDRAALGDATSKADQVQTSEITIVNATRPILDVNLGESIDLVLTTTTLDQNVLAYVVTQNVDAYMCLSKTCIMVAVRT